MVERWIRNSQQFRLAILVLLMLTAAGCFADYWVYSASGGGNDNAVGEEHVVNYPAHDTFLITQDVLRGEGVLFDVEPKDKIVTLWQPADNPPGVWGSLIGVVPRYRYEIQVVAQNPRQSKIIANVRTEDIPEEEIHNYKASARLDLFNDFNRLAAKYPPPPSTPATGGVNFTLLPGEDLRAFAKRVTGSADNWLRIAKDNGLKSPTDLAGVRSVWVSNTLLAPPSPPPSIK